jgi:hypothetical protein
MSDLFQIGETSLVDPAAVIAVDWDVYTNQMPMVWLHGGVSILADRYSIPSPNELEHRQSVIDLLVKDLQVAPKAASTRRR